MKKLSTEFKVGVLVIIGIAILFAGVNYLKGFKVFKDQRDFVSIYENIDGLVESNPVTVSGYKVGQVKKIELAGDGTGRLVVTFTIFENDLKIPVDSKAEVYSSDLLGSKAVRLKLGNSDKFATKLDTLESKTQATLKESVNKEVLPLKRKAEGLISSIDSVVNIVKVILGEDARGRLKRSFQSIEDALASLEGTSRRLDTMIAEEKIRVKRITTNLGDLSDTLNSKSPQISRTLDNLEAVSDSLSKADLTQTINNAKLAMEDISRITSKIDSGEGSIGKLVQEDSLHNSLLEASKDLDRLLKDLRYHPDRYVHFSVFGRKAEGVRLNEEQIERLEKLLEEQKRKQKEDNE